MLDQIKPGTNLSDVDAAETHISQSPSPRNTSKDEALGRLRQTLEFLNNFRGKSTDGRFLENLAIFTGNTLAVDYVMIARLPNAVTYSAQLSEISADESTAVSVAFYGKDKILENIDYQLFGTPCADTVHQDICFHCQNVKSLFPNDAMLVDLNIESYAGIALRNAAGDAIGLIVVMDRNPIDDRDAISDILCAVALPAAAEIERQILQENLELSRQRLEDFADAGSDWFWEMDADLRYTWFSANVVESVGVEPEWHYGKNREELVPDTAKDTAFWQNLALMKMQQPYRDYVFHRSGPSGDHWIRSSAVPTFNEDGNFTGYRGIGTHVTSEVIARKEFETQLILAREEAERGNRAKSEFLASMSHELRTPLNAISGFSQVLEQEIFGAHSNPRYREYAADILSSSNHLIDIVNDILDLSKIESGHAEIYREAFKIEEALSECCRIIDGRLTNDPAPILVDIADTDLELNSDIRLFKQVTINILSNARKYTPGTGEIHIVGRRLTGGETEIIIKDSGCGIAEEDIGKVLEPFGQARTNARVAHEGTGLGLSLSSKLMEALGGQLSLRSQLNVGTSVTLVFPHSIA